MLESTTQACPHCHGTGLIRSDDSMALQVLRALEEEGTRKRSKEVLLKAPVGIVNYLINQKREHIALIEARYGMSVRIEADPMLVSPDYSMEKLKTALRVVPEAPVVSGHAGLMGAPVAEEEDDDLIDDLVEEEAEEAEAEAPAAKAVTVAVAADGDGQPGRKKRRRRRRRRGGAREGEGQVAGATEGDDDGEEGDDEPAEAQVEVSAEAAEPVSEAKPKRTRKPRGGRGEPAVTEAPVAVAAEAVVEVVAEAAPDAVAEEAPAKPAARKRASKAKAAEPVVEPTAEAPVEAAPKPARARGGRAKAVEAPAPALVADPGLEPTAETVVQDPEDAAPAVAAADDSGKPKRKGWWSLGR
jgi:ribonuclease E